jgi:hypothetical protein
MANNQNSFAGAFLGTLQGMLGTFMGIACMGALVVGIVGVCLVGCLLFWASGVESVNARSTETAQARVAPVMAVGTDAGE